MGELVDGAAAGKFGLAVVEGRAGAGKSALLDALAGQAAARNFRVLRAAGLELERDYPFGSVRQLFEPAMHELDPSVRRELFAGAAALAEALLAGRRTGAQLVDPGFALLHSLYWVLVGITDLGPLALVVDDLQWTDRLSLRFLAFAIRRCEGLPLVVALAHRELAANEQAEALAAVLSGPALVIRPTALSSRSIGLLLAQAVGRKLEDEVVAEAERLTEGNPLYVRELADSFRSAARADVEDQRGLLRSSAPSAVGRRVRIAFARLDGPAQALATAAAILGDEIPLHRAAALAGVDHEDASAAADALVRAEVLVVGEPLRFRHPLVREAVLESIDPRARAAMHGRAARLLIAEGEPPERAAIHLLDSDPAADPEAVSTLRAAAKRAVAEAAPELAVAALRRALREPPDRSARPIVLNELAMVESQVGSPEAVGHFEEAFGCAASLEDVADGAVRYAMQLGVRGKPEAADALIDRVLGSISDRERQLMLEAELCTLALSSEIPGARERLARVSSGLRGESPAERVLLGLHANDAANAGTMGASEAARLVSAALGDGFMLQELGPDSPTYVQMVGALQWMDELDLAERELAAASVEARRRGAAFGLAMASSMIGIIAWKRGQLPRAEAEARAGVEVATQMGWVAAFPFPLVCLIEVLNETGALDEADRLLEKNNLNGPLPESHTITELLGARGRLRLSQIRTELGIHDLEEQAARLDRVQDSPPNLRALLAKSLVPALVQVGREQHARRIATQALRIARAFGQPRFIASSMRAHALAHAGGPDIDQLQEAAEIYERIGAPIDLARTLLDIGSLLRRRRQPAVARDPLRRALDITRACGAHPLAERAEHELRATGARPRRDRITGRDALTASERRIAQLAIDGMTNGQIAQALFITRKTVGTHLEHTYRKLGIHTRDELKRALDAEHELTPDRQPLAVRNRQLAR